MATTIQVSKELAGALQEKKMYGKESYEDIIWDLLEDSMELSQETKKEIEKAKREIQNGKYYTHDQVKKELGLL